MFEKLGCTLISRISHDLGIVPTMTINKTIFLKRVFYQPFLKTFQEMGRQLYHRPSSTSTKHKFLWFQKLWLHKILLDSHDLKKPTWSFYLESKGPNRSEFFVAGIFLFRCLYNLLNNFRVLFRWSTYTFVTSEKHLQLSILWFLLKNIKGTSSSGYLPSPKNIL